MRVGTILISLAVLTAALANSGCLSVNDIRDALLLNQEETEVVYWKVTPPPVEYYWEATQVVPPDTESEPLTFRVKEGARWFDLEYTVNLPSSLVPPQEILNITVYFDPHVSFSLQRPDGEVTWDLNLTEDGTDSFRVNSPESGVWILKVNAKGYGFEAGGLEVRDQLRVVVELFEPK